MAQFTRKQKNEQTPLINAVVHKNHEEVFILVKQGHDINERDELGDTPLMKVCTWMNKAITTFLVVSGSDINAKNLTGRTPLMIACHHGCAPVIRLLVKHGCDLNAQDNRGRTALWCCFTCRTVKLLLDKGCDPFVMDKDRKYALNYYETKHARSIIIDKMNGLNTRNRVLLLLVLKKIGYTLQIDMIKEIFKYFPLFDREERKSMHCSDSECSDYEYSDDESEE